MLNALFDHPFGWVCHMIWVLLALFVLWKVARWLFLPSSPVPRQD